MKFLNKERLLLLAILLLSLFVRIYKVSEVPTALYIDEVAMFVDVKSILLQGTDMHGLPWYQLIFPSYGDYKMPVYIWLATICAKIFGLSEVVFKIPTIVAGVATVALGYFIVKELLVFTKTKFSDQSKMRTLTQRAGLSVALILAITPWSIVFSRAAFEGHLAQAFFGGSILLQLIGLRKKSVGYIAGSILLGVIATYTYYSVRFVWVGVFISLWLLYFKRFQRNWKHLDLKWLSASLVGVLAYGLLLLPLQYSPFYGATDLIRLNTDSVLKIDDQVLTINQYRLFAGNTIIDRLLFNSYTFTARELIKNYSDHLSINFLFLNGDPNLRHGTGRHGEFLLPMALFFLMGIVTLVKAQKGVLAFLGIWILLAFLPASVPQNTPHALRSLNALLPFSVIIGLGLSECITFLVSKENYFKKAAVSGLLLLTAVSFFEFFYFYINQYKSISKVAWYSQFSEIAEKIETLRTSNEPVYVAGVNDKFFIWSLYKGPYLEQGVQIQKENQFVFEEFNDIHIGKLPDQAVTGAIIATTKEQWQQFQTKFPTAKAQTIEELTVDDGTTYIITKLL